MTTVLVVGGDEENDGTAAADGLSTVSWTQSTVPFWCGNEGQSFHYGSLSAAAVADRQSSQLGRPLRNVFLSTPSQSVRNLSKLPSWIFNFQPFTSSSHTHTNTHAVKTCNFIYIHVAQRFRNSSAQQMYRRFPIEFSKNVFYEFIF